MNYQYLIYKRKFFRLLKYIVLSMWAMVTIFPLYWTLVNSFRTNRQIFRSFSLFPESLANLNNYKQIIELNNIPRAFYNTATITMFSMVLLLFCTIGIAFLISVYKFRFAFAIQTFFVLGIMIPRLSVLIPTYMNFNNMGLLGMQYSLVLCYAAFEMPMAVFLLCGFIRSLPHEVYESAIIDGCNSPQLLTNIVLPMSRNGIVTVIIYTGVSVWNEYMYAMIFLTNKAQKTIPSVIASARTEYVTEFGMLMAGVILTVAPIILIYSFLQDRIITGMAMGAVKG
ncbi:MAG: carbohydrate ABC transporter permease [Oscillospiraceae bacterium]|nr:carbohydrate ABC transporter permease [Oscillospiraceae bacterium]